MDKLKELFNNTIDIIDTNNLPINSSVVIEDDNVYKDLKVEVLIHQAISYLIHDKPIPKDMKDVLHYYGIVDHFYPINDCELSVCEEVQCVGEGLSGSTREERIKRVKARREDRTRNLRRRGSKGSKCVGS